MIPVLELIYDIDLKLNKLSNLENQSIPLENKIIALNEQLIALIKNKIGFNNIYQLGLDAFKKRYEDLQVLIVPFDSYTLKPTLKDKHLNKWSAALSELPNYMFYIDGYILADKGECKNRVITINHDLTKHADVQTLLSNSLYKPSFEYQETFNTLSNNQLEIYTDGTFTPTKVFPSYLRYPKYIDVEGWQHLDGTDSINQDCELPYYLKDELINLTVKQLSEITENVPQIQISQDRIKNQE